VAKTVEIRQDNLHTKFSALSVNYDGPSFDFLGSKKPVHESINEWYLRKSHFIAVSQSFVETVWACCISQQALGMSFLVISASMTFKDPQLPK